MLIFDAKIVFIPKEEFLAILSNAATVRFQRTLKAVECEMVVFPESGYNVKVVEETLGMKDS